MLTPFVRAALAPCLLAVTVVIAPIACSAANAPDAPSEAEALYPTLSELYGSEHGIYAGCGPNNGVCHNSKQFPNLATLGSLVDHIGDPCNQLQDQPEKLHDLCERPGDRLEVGNERIEIAWVERIDTDPSFPRQWRVALGAPYPAGAEAGARQGIVRTTAGTEVEVAYLANHVVDVDAIDASRIVLTLPPAPVTPPADPTEDELDYEELDPGAFMSLRLQRAGVPADPESVQVGDPNRNATFGAALGGKLIAPGDPGRSYLLRRLLDPSAGPLMPLANCCFWTKSSLRALYCWISGLAPDGSNALDPIDYASCPPGPVESVDYPEPGEGCEGSGMCPVQSRAPVSSEPSWANVYGSIMTRRCAGSGCHFDGGSNLDLGSEDSAYGNLVDGRIVVPGDPAASVLIQRITMTCAPGEPCDRMPFGLDPLSPDEQDAMKNWIASGASR